MKLQFKLEYKTEWGQAVRVEAVVKRRKGADVITHQLLNTNDGVYWSGELVLYEKDACSFCYTYQIVAGDEVVRKEWNAVPRTFPYDQSKTFLLEDYWKDLPLLSHLYSSAYSLCVAHSLAHEPQISYYDRTLLFRVQAPQLVKGQQLALLGSLPQLGEWMPERAIRMSRGGTHEWCLALSAAGLQFPFEYKYVVVDEDKGDLLCWEEGENRLSPSMECALPEGVNSEFPIYNSFQDKCVLPGNAVQVIWDRRLRMKDEHWKAAGVVLPVFSMRSESSQGIGDFGDLRKMVDWAVATGMRVIQILPIYDTTQTGTWRDCYPYNAISIYALHPIYIDLSQLPSVEDANFMEAHRQECMDANKLHYVDYERSLRLKMNYLHRFYEEQGANIITSQEYRKFLRCNEDWLIPYSVFCHRRDQEHTCAFQEWSILSTYNAKDVRLYAEEHSHEVNFHSVLQFLLARQLASATSYARNHGILLKGDIPIGISRTSVEAWMEPKYFNMQGSAGAPPDDFSRDGQNWGFPTYNWEQMAQDGNSWWVRRFRKMAEYFDAYRIDHVLGFFRIWEIPVQQRSGLLGHFAPCLPLSIDEIERAGLKWREEFFTQPYITDAYLRTLLRSQQQLDLLRSIFLEAKGPDWYCLREGFRTEADVEAFFSETPAPGLSVDYSPHAGVLRDTLRTLVQNVLFIPHQGGFLPRICAQKTEIYTHLTTSEQEAFNRIYDNFYYHRHNEFWGGEAMKKLPALVESTQMLCCAEDLGMVPDCVAPVMNRLHILSLEIQTMPKSPGVRFAGLENNPYMSVATIFTHDMPTLRLWWQEDAERRQAYFNTVLQKDGRAPQEMPGWLCEEVLARHLFSPSMLCLISLQDWLSMDESLRSDDVEGERINVPSNPHHYWRYRMHLTIEQLLSQQSLNSRMQTMIYRSGRR